MAITIRNKQTEAAVRELGKRWGVGHSAVITRLAEEELARLGERDPKPPSTSAELWDDLMAMAPTFTEAEKRQVWDEMDHMYDYMDEDEVRTDNGDRHIRPRRRLSTGG